MTEPKAGEGIFLLKVKPGTAEKAIRELRRKSEVSEARSVLGPYDVVATGAFRTVEDLRDFAEGVLKAEYCEDCVPNLSVEHWKREKPQQGEVEAWTLIKAENPTKLADELQRLPVVNAVYSTLGPYNVIAKLAAQTPRDLQDTILKKVQTIPGVRRTESLAMAEEPL